MTDMKSFQWMVGTESEFGAASRPTSGDAVAQRLVQTLARAKVYSGVKRGSSGLWLMQGGSAYYDVGNHPEYCTPECLWQDIAKYEWAGPLIMQDLALASDWSFMPPGDDVWLLKNNTDAGARNAYGNHLNFMMPCLSKAGGDVMNFQESLESFAEATGSMMATLPLIVGAGVVVSRFTAPAATLGGKDFAFRISARSAFVSEVVGNSSTRGRPFFLSRAEHHAKKDLSYRLQVLLLDANILPSVIELKMGLIVLMLRMWAAGEIEPLRLSDPVDALHRVSEDWRAPLEVEGGRWMTAAEIQAHYLHEAKCYVKCHGLWEFGPLLEAWEYQVGLFLGATEVPRELCGRNDWVTKWLLIEGKLAQPVESSYRTAEEISLKYHGFLLGERFNMSLPVKLAQRYGPPGFLQAAREACFEPPANSRAQMRRRFIEILQEHAPVGWEDLAGVDWPYLKYDNITLMTDTPWVSEPERLELLRRKLTEETRAA